MKREFFFFLICLEIIKKLFLNNVYGKEKSIIIIIIR